MSLPRRSPVSVLAWLLLLLLPGCFVVTCSTA